MGGKSKSSSSTTNQTYNVDERIGASDNAVVLSNNIDGDNNIVSDYGAISGALDFANSTISNSQAIVDKALSANTAANKQSLDFAEDALKKVNDATDKAYNFSQNVADDAFDFSDKSVSKSYNFANNAMDFAEQSQRWSYDSLNQNTKLAFDFANNATISADERIVSKTLPVLIIGGFLLISVALMGGKKS